MKKVVIIGICVFVAYLLLKRFSKKEDKRDYSMNKDKINQYMELYKPMRTVSTGNLANDIVSFIQEKEGGLSKDKADSASSDVVGVSHTYKGTTSDQWHTNKGITWKAFKNLANKLGYSGDSSTFYSMPNSVWLKIYREGYFKPVEKFTNSELINYYLSLWVWGSGQGGATALINRIEKESGSINELLRVAGEKATLRALINARIAFYERLTEAKPQNKKFLKGWINPQLNFWKLFGEGK